MKNIKKIISALCVALAITTLVLAVAIYQNGREGVIAAKKSAEMTLRDAAEQVINREYEMLKIPFFASQKGKKILSRRRRIISEKGDFFVEVDSLKESQALYSLDKIGSKLLAIEIENPFVFDKVLSAWKEKIEAEYGSIKCAIYLKKTPFDGSQGSEYCLGDSSACNSQYVLGTYYVDDMYTTTMTAYFIPPSFWICVKWSSPGLMVTYFLWISLGGVLLFSLMHKPLEINEDVEEHQNRPDKIPTSVVIMGTRSLDPIKRILTYKGSPILCSSQISALCYAFALAPNYSLSKQEVDEACGWNSEDYSLGGRRRTAISSLNKFLKDNADIKVERLPDNNGYYLVEIL